MSRGHVCFSTRSADDDGAQWWAVANFPGQDEWGVHLSDIVELDGIDLDVLRTSTKSLVTILVADLGRQPKSNLRKAYAWQRYRDIYVI